MKLDSPIKAEWFYKDESEKTKINWFSFEYALEFYTFIMKSEALRKYRARYSSAEIAAFCAYFAKKMKKSVYDWLAGTTSAVIIDEEYIVDYYPKNTQRGVCQDSCRKSSKNYDDIFTSWTVTSERSGLSHTSGANDQSRVFRDHRSGWTALALS
jgi:hypothetical protein